MGNSEKYLPLWCVPLQDTVPSTHPRQDPYPQILLCLCCSRVVSWAMTTPKWSYIDMVIHTSASVDPASQCTSQAWVGLWIRAECHALPFAPGGPAFPGSPWAPISPARKDSVCTCTSQTDQSGGGTEAQEAGPWLSQKQGSWVLLNKFSLTTYCKHLFSC